MIIEHDGFANIKYTIIDLTSSIYHVILRVNSFKEMGIGLTDDISKLNCITVDTKDVLALEEFINDDTNICYINSIIDNSFFIKISKDYISSESDLRICLISETTKLLAKLILQFYENHVK